MVTDTPHQADPPVQADITPGTATGSPNRLGRQQSTVVRWTPRGWTNSGRRIDDAAG